MKNLTREKRAVELAAPAPANPVINRDDFENPDFNLSVNDLVSVSRPLMPVPIVFNESVNVFPVADVVLKLLLRAPIEEPT